MEKNLYIDASHPNETRVVLKSGENIEDYEYEGLKNNLIKNNIYLGKVSRIEPSLQAAFVDFGRERHGFLSFNDIQSDYYQIPKADLERIKEEEEKAREELSREVEAKEEENIAEGKLENKEIKKILDDLENKFKPNLDKYKYPSRFSDIDQYLYRDKNLCFLKKLNSYLENNKSLNCEHLTLLDYAIFPFIRGWPLLLKVKFNKKSLCSLSSFIFSIASNLFCSIFSSWIEIDAPVNPPENPFDNNSFCQTMKK